MLLINTELDTLTLILVFNKYNAPPKESGLIALLFRKNELVILA